MKKLNIVYLAGFLIIILFAFIVIFPVLIAIISSFKTNQELYTNLFGLPEKSTLLNYSTALVKGKMLTYLFNTVLVTLFSTLLIVIIASLASFGFSRDGFRQRRWLYSFFIIGMTIPVQVAMVSLYLQLSKLGLTNSYIGLISTYAAFGTAFAIFIYSGFIKTVPKVIEEAAVIDGCSMLSTYMRIIMPICKSATMAIIIFRVVWIWNDLTFPLLLVTKDRFKTMAIGLMNFRGEFNTDYGPILAGVVFMSLPLLVIYILFQKQFVSGVTVGSIKG